MKTSPEQVALIHLGLVAAAQASIPEPELRNLKPTQVALDAIWDAGYRLPETGGAVELDSPELSEAKDEFFSLGIPAAARASQSMTDPAVVKPAYAALHAAWDAGYRLAPITRDTPTLAEDIGNIVTPHADTLTLGDVAMVLTMLKDAEITKESILHALDHVFY